MMFEPNKYEFKDEVEFDRDFKSYCDMCWGMHFGPCRKCTAKKEKYRAEHFGIKEAK